MADETVAVASFMHESNSFVQNPAVTSREDYKLHGEYFGDELVRNLRGTETHAGGIIDAAEERDIELLPIMSALGRAGAPVSEDTYEFYTDTIVEGVREHAEEVDGVMLPLHGTMVPERLDVLCIPSFIAFLGDYEPLSGGVVLSDTPGASAVNPARFDYEKIPRPIFPLDDLPDDYYPN